MQILTPYSINTRVKYPNFKANRTDEEVFKELHGIDSEKDALLFIRKQSDLINPVDTNGDHIIHVVVKKDFFETLKQMLQNPQKTQEMLELRGENGRTPLAVAQSNKIARLILTKGGNPYALDDNFEPAGANKYLPEDFRQKIIKVTNEKLKQAKAAQPKVQEQPVQTQTVEQSKPVEEPKITPQPQTNSQLAQPKVDTTPLNNKAAETEYSKIETQTPKTEEKPGKSFFSMFKPKKGVNDGVNERAKEGVNEGGKIENKEHETKTEVPTTVKETTAAKPTVEQKVKEPKKEIKISGTEAFKRLDTPEIDSLDYVVGLEDIKTKLRKSIVEPVLDEKIAQELTDNYTNIPSGIIFNAPPGNGKTALVKALGGEASMPVFEVSNVSEIEQLINVIGKNFDETRQRAIIYMRGLDNLYEENNPTGELTNSLNRSLNNTADRGALLVFSVECTDRIPRTILTPSKIDKIFTFKAPDTEARLNFIERYIENKELLKDIDKKLIAEKTQGFSIAQIKHIIDDAVLYTATEFNEKVTNSELLNRIKEFSKEQNIPEINEYNKTSMYDTTLKRYQPTVFDAENFESIAGMPTTKSSVEESILKPWKNADKLREAKIQLPAGGVFAGDPGTSKTYMAKALARSLGMPLYVLKMSEVGSSYVHETSKRIGQIVDQLIRKFDETGEGSILLMDEIDHFQKGQSQSGAEEVNTLLQEIERGRNKILFIGTTNELECLPDSLTRDGRMGTVIHFEHCDGDAAGTIIKNMLKARETNPDAARILQNSEFLDKIAQRCSGMVAASVSAIVNDALADSVINGTSLEESFDAAVKIRKKKDIEKMLSKNSKMAGHRLNISEDSTIMYDTKYPRMSMGETDPKSLDSLGGMEDVKEPLRNEIIDTYQPETMQLLKENKLPITKGFILHGPPGNGKTTIIKALANEMGLPVYPLNSGNIGSSYIHQLARNAQEVRDQLAYKFKMTGERSILFMDEAQQLVPRTSGTLGAHSHNVEETNFFKDMIMTAEQDGIIYAMATNDLNQIEPAFYENSDRLGVCVYVGNPDYNSRVGIIKKLLDDRPITKAINNDNAIQILAEMFEGQSISKISQSILNIVRDCIKSRGAVTLESSLKTIARSL